MARNTVNILEDNLRYTHTLTINIQLTNKNNCFDLDSYYENPTPSIHTLKHFLKLYIVVYRNVFLWENMHNIEFTILTYFKYTIQWH